MPVLEKKRKTRSGENGGEQPRYVTLVNELRSQILRRELNVGDRLPSFAEFRLKYGVTPTTTERVYSLLEQEGLIERRHGVGTFVAEPKQSLTGNIGFIGSMQAEWRRNPFNAHIMEGVQQMLTVQQRHLLHMGTDYALKLQACEKVDGVLICNIEETTPVLQQLPASLPRVSLLNVAPGVVSVVADDHGGARMAVQQLLEMGHRRVACLMEKLPSIARRRAAGYFDAMLAAGIEPQESWVRLTEKVPRNSGKNQPYLHWSRTQMRDWLANGWRETGCTAIVVQNEVAAIGVMQVLQEENVKVPQQVSVIGFDGTEACDYVVPRLTAIELPLAEVGAKSVEVLGRQIAGEEMGEQVIVLPMKVREGDSVAPPQNTY